MNIGEDDLLAYAHQIHLDKRAVGRAVEMVHDALVFYDHLHGLVESVLKRSIVRALLQQSLGVLGEYILDERRYVLKMIVKGVAIDSALLDDILYGYLVEGAGVKQLEKSLFYRLAGKGRHVVSSQKVFLYRY